MSKQANEVENHLRVLFPDLETERVFGKIIGSQAYSSIRVDFYIPSINCIVEVHGIQHFKPSGFGRNKIDTMKALNDQISRDMRLRDLCKTYDINYEEIDYTENISFLYILKKFSKYMEDECISE